MINKSNDLPSFVNETNLPNIVNKLTDAKNIKISNNKYGNRVQTVVDKIVEKADDITKAIKQEVVNNSYSFKVGTGDVDVSTDVEDGFGEVGIKGVTYHNLFNDFSIADDAKNYISINGDKIKWNKSEVTTHNTNIKYHNSLAKPNKTYTLVFYIYKNTLKKETSESIYNVAKFNIISYNQGFYAIKNNDTGLIKVKLVQPTAVPSDGKPYLEVYKDAVGEFEISHPILLEGDCTNNPNLPSQLEGIVGVGDKSKNLFNPKSVKFGINLNTNTGEEMNSHVYVTSDFIPVLEKTDYTVKGLPVIHYYNESKEQIAVKNTPVEGVIRTPQNCKWIRMRNYDQIPITEQKLLIKKSSFILGTYDTFEPYYEGHKIEILSSGHNLLDLLSLKCIIKKHVTKHELTSNSISFSVGTENSDPWASIMFDGFKFKENATYRVKAKCKTTDNTNAPFISLRRKDDYNNSFMDMKFTNGILNTTFLANNVGDRVEFFAGVNKGNKGGCQVDFWDVCITEELSNEDLPFQPYLKDTNSITIDSPLMRLPNGVCDEITRDGKLIRRVGKVVFTGIESWNISKTSDKTILFEVGVSNIKIDKRGDILPICDKLLASLQSNVWVNDIEGVSYTDSNSNRFRIRINKNRLDTQDLTGFKKWLSQNPTTVYYELSTPIITELPAPCLRIFKDGHLTFNTLVAPESNHVVQLNKSAQIQNAIKESQSLDNKINVLENNYDNLILFTMSRLNDLELNYTLK